MWGVRTRLATSRKLGAGAPLMVLMSVLVIACSDSGDDAAPLPATSSPPNATEQAYLDEVLEIDTLIGAVVVTVEAALEGSYATRGRLFTLIGEQDVYGTFETMVERLDAVEVPTKYQADHQRYLESLNESVLLAEQLQPAIEARELVTFDVTTVELFVSRARLLVEVSPSFCAGALRSDAVPGCPSPEAAPGGQYGADLRNVFRRFRADFGPRVGAFPPAMNSDEIFDELNILQPPIIDAIEAATEEIHALEPPSEFAEDHAVIERYFEDTLEVSISISEAAQDRDAAAQASEFGRSGDVQCEAALALSPEATEITQYFNDTLC